MVCPEPSLQFNGYKQLFENLQWYVTKILYNLRPSPLTMKGLQHYTFFSLRTVEKRGYSITTFKHMQSNPTSSLLPINPRQKIQRNSQNIS